MSQVSWRGWMLTVTGWTEKTSPRAFSKTTVSAYSPAP